ncbi:hypothetical protein K491DRAFT_683754 [Lophiostoma macrostomum CBS 122681]|uniref:Uncharacterized protein n=1 Tax=Lophiostoma macrostomum CBS 122681 TaxID=1314788 RepID=A0A6A6SSN5_9PLEO|nr:hypothetical protein K491DRAFT_683754 [Lophiostoma macrostomum CBS 122681]
MYSYLLSLFRKLVPRDSYSVNVPFVTGVFISCGLAMLTGGPNGLIVGYGAASIVIFVPLIGLSCQHLGPTVNDTDGGNVGLEAVVVAREVAQPVVPGGPCLNSIMASCSRPQPRVAIVSRLHQSRTKCEPGFQWTLSQFYHGWSVSSSRCDFSRPCINAIRTDWRWNQVTPVALDLFCDQMPNGGQGYQGDCSNSVSRNRYPARSAGLAKALVVKYLIELIRLPVFASRNGLHR